MAGVMMKLPALSLCFSLGMGALSSLPLLGSAMAAETVPQLIEQFDEADSTCRLSKSDDVRIKVACVARSIYGVALNERGWCYGRQDQANAEMDWHECKASSLRFPPPKIESP